MIELLVTAQGLSVHHAMYAVVMTDARERVQVMSGSAHPPTYVAADAVWGMYDEGGTPAQHDVEKWLKAVYGQSAGALLPMRRVNVVDAGDGIAITAPERGAAKLTIRPSDGGRLQEFSWAGVADFTVDGIVNVDDLIAFLDAWGSGRGDFDGDGAATGMDVAVYVTIWQNGGRPICQADVNRDGAVDAFDLLLYLDWWNAVDSRADMGGVSPGVIDVLDLSSFIGVWLDGC